MVKSPKIFIRDSGLLHALLGLESSEDLFGHPVYGSSYEGFVIENVLSRLPRWRASFYRTSNRAEIDLIIQKGSITIAIEIKASTSPKVSKGFWSSIETIKPDQAVIIAPVTEEYPVSDTVTVKPLGGFIKQIGE